MKEEAAEDMKNLEPEPWGQTPALQKNREDEKVSEGEVQNRAGLTNDVVAHQELSDRPKEGAVPSETPAGRSFS